MTPYVTINSNDQIIQDWVINGNGTNSVEFELPEDQAYFAVPYLLPTRGGKYEFRSNVRHGNTIKLPYFNGVVDEFKQLSYSENGDKYTFKCQAHAICNPKDDEFWKLYYEDDNGEKVFFDTKTYEEPSVTTPNSAEFEFEIELESNLFKDGKKDIKLGIATFTKSYFIMLASDPQIFELSTEDDRWVDLGLPSGILWAKYNVGATSPEEYGGYYAWGETEEKDSYTLNNYLWQGIEFQDNYDISGTQYDVAHVKWGDGARMPTKDELAELEYNTTHKLDTYNGIKGCRIIGPNNNSIFLPYAKKRGTLEYDWTNEYGIFWGSTICICDDGDGPSFFRYCTELDGELDCDWNYYYSKSWGNNVYLGFGHSVRPVKDSY